MAEDVVVVVNINKVNVHTRLNTSDTDHLGDVVLQINVCELSTMENHPMGLIG